MAQLMAQHLESQTDAIMTSCLCSGVRKSLGSQLAPSAFAEATRMISHIEMHREPSAVLT